MKRILFPVLTAVLGAGIFIAAVELTSRFVLDDGMQFDLEMWKYARDVKVVSDDPIIGHEHGPNRQARLMGVDVRTNAHGLRDREYPIERTPGTLRIVMLGDSLTEGWGVPYDETFSKRVERMYAERGIKAEVINTGVGNWNTTQEVQYYLEKAARYKPDIVVLNFFVNDAEPLPENRRPPSFLQRNCYACILVVGRLDTLLRQMSTRKDYADFYLGLYADGHGQGWLDAKASIGRLAEETRQNGAKLLIASLPELHDVKNYRFGRITDLVRGAAEENGVSFVDVLPYLRDQESAKLWVTPPDPHPNGFANGFIAQGLFEALQKLEPARTAGAVE
jgi:lysophospholipase L1-like esterase